MGQPVTLKPSRTFALAAFGLLVLALIGLGLFLALGWALNQAPGPGGPDNLSGHLVQALQVVAGCIATVSTAGAGSMAARDWRSGGLTSSQAHQVLAGRSMPAEDPRAAQAQAGAAMADDLAGP